MEKCIYCHYILSLIYAICSVKTIDFQKMSEISAAPNKIRVNFQQNNTEKERNSFFLTLALLILEPIPNYIIALKGA